MLKAYLFLTQQIPIHRPLPEYLSQNTKLHTNARLYILHNMFLDAVSIRGLLQEIRKNTEFEQI